MGDLWVRCEHGYMTAHCDEHPGSQSHFGVATHKGGCFGRRLASDAEILAAAANLDGAEPDYEAALRALADALRALRRNHISLLPRHEFAITDDAGIQRMELEQAVKLAIDVAFAGRKLLPLPDKETPNE